MEYLFGLIGEKLGHSFSPMIHSIILEKLNIDGHYHLFEIERENLIKACTGLKYLGVKGVNVTIPYKVEVMKALDHISDEAQKIGAVNTISFRNNEAYGFNTDYYGFGMLMDKYQINITGSSAVVLGTGGAANSVIHYLKDRGIKKITAASRDVESAHKRIKDADICTYNEIQYLKGYDIIINCTPCGMYPKTDACAVTFETLKRFSYAVDLIYNPHQTLFLKMAAEMGLKAVNGLYMLVGQAVKAQQIWNEISIPDEWVDEIYMKVSQKMYSRDGLQ